MKLFTKYIRINLPMMVVIFTLSAGFNYLLVNDLLIRAMDVDLSDVEGRVRDYFARYHRFPTVNSMDEVRFDYRLTNEPANKTEYSLSTLYSDRERKMHDFRQIVFTVADGPLIYKVTVAKPLRGLHHLSNAIFFVSLTIILASILTVLFIYRTLLRRIWQPFYGALQVMKDLKLRDINDTHFPVTTIEEFSFMNESLGMVADKAKQDYRLLKEFTENGSHELQTPLSIIRSKLEMLMQEEYLSERQSEIVHSAYAPIKKLSRLSQSLLMLVKIRNQQFPGRENIDLKEKIETNLELYAELWEVKDIRVSWELETAIIQASPELIDVLLNNLLSNASNHNIPFGMIGIRLQPNRLSISNSGGTLLPDPLRLVSPVSNAGQGGGQNGLGLLVIKEICDVTGIVPSYQFTDEKHRFTFTW